MREGHLLALLESWSQLEAVFPDIDDDSPPLLEQTCDSCQKVQRLEDSKSGTINGIIRACRK